MDTTILPHVYNVNRADAIGVKYHPQANTVVAVATMACMALDMFGTTGKRIKALRTSRDINQKELVAALKGQGVDVGPSFLSQIESSRKTPSIELLIALAKSLGTTTDYLLMLTNDPAPSASTESQIVIDVQDAAERALIEEWVDVMQDIEPERRENVLRSVRLMLSALQSPRPRIIGE